MEAVELLRISHYGNIVDISTELMDIIKPGYYGNIVYNIPYTKKFIVVSITPHEIEDIPEWMISSRAKEELFGR